ncbi:hypothetical protein Tco_1519248, partial [Tanacetum coccineum]
MDEGFATDIGSGFIVPARVSCEEGAETVELAPNLMDARDFPPTVLCVRWEASKSFLNTFRRPLAFYSSFALLRRLLLIRGALTVVSSSSTKFGAAPMVDEGPTGGTTEAIISGPWSSTPSPLLICSEG